MNELIKLKLLDRDRWKCHYCKTPLLLTDVTIDHKKPKAKGGKNVLGNYVASCENCNHEKGDMDYIDFMNKISS